MFQSALAFSKLLRKKLEHEDIVVNPYDPCFTNKIMDDKQMTVTWYVDDLEESHVEEAEVKKFGDYLKATFERNDLKVTHRHGPVHEYHGIGLDYSDK